MRMRAARAILKSNVAGYFRNPTGIVFITLFVLAGATFQFFWQDAFFSRNLADLDPLNRWFPYLLLFLVPAITMGIWADERRQGTEELLMTLPAAHAELVLGKYFACLGIYLAALALSLSHVVVLGFLGRPDLGLMASNYLGYALAGAALLAVGMAGSSLSESTTVGFILGAVFCALFVFAPAPLGIREPLEDFASGAFSPSSAAYFILLAAAMLYANLVLIGRRHWAGRVASQAAHHAVRILAVVAMAASLQVILVRLPLRADLTSERLHTLSEGTRQILDGLPRPVYIQAFVSPEVPKDYVPAREGLLALLREYQARGGGQVVVKVHATEPSSSEAQEAEERFGIRSETVMAEEEGRYRKDEIYLGLAFSSGADELVIPFLHRGLPLEYELTRSVQVVSRSKRRKVGLLQTDARISGGFDFSRMGMTPEWSIVSELKKQYEVTDVSAEADYPEDLDVLVVAMPSSLTQEELDRLQKWILNGKAALLFDDPMPYFVDPGLAPQESKGRRGAAPKEKGAIQAFFRKLGVQWVPNEIVWDRYNPHPQHAMLPPEFVFVSPGSQARQPFNLSEPAAAGLQEALLLFPGRLESAKLLGLDVFPLLTTGPNSGILPYGELVQRSFMGPSGFNPNPQRRQAPGDKVLAARIHGFPDPQSLGLKEGEHPPIDPVRVIAVADLDLISEQFFELRRQGAESLHFDNVTFVLNCVDVLAGDSGFIPLRKRRAALRTLEEVERRSAVHTQKQLQEVQTAEQKAALELQAAQARFDGKVKALRARTDLDEQAKDAMIAHVEEVENRRLQVERSNIESKKRREIEKSQARMSQELKGIQKRIQGTSLLIFPVPAAALAFLYFAVRMILARRGRVQEESRRGEEEKGDKG